MDIITSQSQLVLQLPTSSNGVVPNYRSFRWCKALFDALQPLRKYKLQDGSDALFVSVAAGNGIVAYWDESWDRTEVRDFEQSYPNFVCKISLMQSKNAFVDIIFFSMEDFCGDASVAKEKFNRVLAHLAEHAVQQIMPKWFTKSISALQNK